MTCEDKVSVCDECSEKSPGPPENPERLWAFAGRHPYVSAVTIFAVATRPLSDLGEGAFCAVTQEYIRADIAAEREARAAVEALQGVRAALSERASALPRGTNARSAVEDARNAVVDILRNLTGEACP